MDDGDSKEDSKDSEVKSQAQEQDDSDDSNMEQEECNTKKSVTDEQQGAGDYIKPYEEDQEEQETSEDCDLEELSYQNKQHKPYRDAKTHVTDKGQGDDLSSQSSSVARSSIDSREIRTRVKKSLDKKQRDMRRRKRGEASAVTRSRRENRDIVKQGSQSWKDGW